MRKKDKRAQPRGERSIDGIITSNPRLNETIAGPRGRRAEGQFGSLGLTEARNEGFHPLRAGVAPVGSSPEIIETDLLDEPIVLEDIKPRERKLPKSKLPKRPLLRKYLKRTSLVLLAIILAGGFYLGYKFYKTQRHVLAGGGQAPAVCDGNVPVNQLKTEGDSRVNVLLLGIGGEEHSDGPYLTDTIIIASIDPINDKMDLLSIPRDLYVKIDGNGSDRINATFLYGRENTKSTKRSDQDKAGLALVDKTLEAVIGVPIHYHAVVDFEAFRQSVNALGGVDINVPKELAVKEQLWDEGTGKNYQLNVPAGQQHFDGTRALFFARSRYTSARGDFDRSERQRLTLVAVKEKALSLGTLTNPVKISSLLDSLGNNVYTDFDSQSIKCLSKQLSEITSNNTASLDLVTPPHDLLKSGNIVGRSTLVPKAGAYNYKDVQNYVRTALRDSFIAKENSSVAVYNATTIAGLAKTKADELKSFGYNVTTVDNAPKQTNPLVTIVVDLSKGVDKYTRNYLEQRFKVSAQDAVSGEFGISPPTGTKFVIIVGKDANGTSR